MESIIRRFPTLLTDTYEQGKFNKNDLIAMLQGITGFAKAIASRNPLDFIDAALGVASSFAGKACLKTLDQYLDSVKQWLTFGEKYIALTDSSDLDFDQVAVSSVPEIMQVTGFCIYFRLVCTLLCLHNYFFNSCLVCVCIVLVNLRLLRLLVDLPVKLQ